MRASETDRGVICPASLVLPRYGESTNATVAAEYGTLAHRWVETGRLPACSAKKRRRGCGCDGCVLEKKVLMSGIDRRQWWPKGEHEVTFALELFTLELRYYRGPRREANAWKARFYSKPRWLTGTIDYRGTIDRRPWVDDFKSGKWQQDYRKPQVSCYLLPRWVEEGCPYDALYFRSITQWPKYPLDELPSRTGLAHPMRGAGLHMHLDALRWAAEHPDEVNPEPIYTGPYDPDVPLSVCAFCPCRPVTHELMNNYRYRAQQHCWPGIMKRINAVYRHRRAQVE